MRRFFVRIGAWCTAALDWLTAPIPCPHGTDEEPECLRCWQDRQL